MLPENRYYYLLFIYLLLEEDGVEPQLPNKQLSFLFTAPRTRSGRMVRTSNKVVLRLYFLTKVRKTDRIKTLFFSWNVKCRIYCPGNVKRSFYFLYVINNPPPPLPTPPFITLLYDHQNLVDQRWIIVAFKKRSGYPRNLRKKPKSIKDRIIECFHSRGQHLRKFIGTKESVCIRKEFNSQRISLGHQHGRCFIVLGHQYGRPDVMWKHSIPTTRLFKQGNVSWE